MEKRMQSPSSIKTYKQCPRKYYYQYILGLPSPPNIHTVRGNVAHDVLEKFFDIDTSVVGEDYQTHLKLVVQKMLLLEWQNYKDEFDKLDLDKMSEIRYFEETLLMLLNWLELFFKKIESKQGTFQERFMQLIPERELLIESETHHAKGYIDVIEKTPTGVRLMDYKTSKNHDINDHILQLGIYSLLYKDKYGYLPEQVGVYFLKGAEAVVDVDEELVAMAKREIEHVHASTQTDDVTQYPKIVTPLCKYSTGQCPFYDVCRPHG